MTKTEKATQWMENLAGDNSHGYDQIYRWGEKGDYDCSSAVISAWQYAGVPVKSNGATYTGNMYNVFIKLGFKDVTKSVNLNTGAGCIRGDVLLNHQKHVAMYIGNGKEVEASINEKGTATGGQPGDQTGQEIKIRSYRNYPWNVVLRYNDADGSNSSSQQEDSSLLKKGSEGDAVGKLQEQLNQLGYELSVDKDFGPLTEKAVLDFQKKQNLEVDGIVGPLTLKAIEEAIKAQQKKPSENLTPIEKNEIGSISKGDIVNFTGNKHYTSSYSRGKEKPCKPGEAVVVAVNKIKNAVHPYNLKATDNSASTVYGWVDEKDIQKITPTKDLKETIGQTINLKLKYNSENKPLECMMTNSTCYLSTRKMSVKGVLWHSTGANNPNLKRYVQPSSNDKNYYELLSKLGTNSYGNDWNHTTVQAGLNAWIGKLADGTVTTVQTMPWDYRPWGCGAGPKGTCNDNWIQFEICEDDLNNKDYFSKCYNEAVHLTAYLCKLYNINPKGSVNYNGIQIPTILCHADSHSYGVGGNHGDVYHWFKKYGKTMDDVRNDVTNLLNISQDPAKLDKVPLVVVDPSYADIKSGDIITLSNDAVYISGNPIPTWVFKSTLYAREIRDDELVFSTQATGPITGIVPINYASKKEDGQTTFEAYKVKITANKLNVREGASSDTKIVTTVAKDDIYTIVDEKGNWGKLKSGLGWISLKYAEKV